MLSIISYHFYPLLVHESEPAGVYDGTVKVQARHKHVEDISMAKPYDPSK